MTRGILALLCGGVSVLSGCDGCGPEPGAVAYPPPLHGPPRPHEGPTTKRWTGPCWRDLALVGGAGDALVETSTSYDYDGAGFVTHLEHELKAPRGVFTIDKTFHRLEGGAIVDEHRKLGRRSIDIRYRFLAEAKGSPVPREEPVLLEPREDPLLCLCPASDHGVCYLGEQVFCRSHAGQVFTDVGSQAFSCIACADHIRLVKTGVHSRDQFAPNMIYEKVDGGMEVRHSRQFRGAPAIRYVLDDAGGLREVQPTPADPPGREESKHPLRPLREGCEQGDGVRCTFDDHGNLLERQRLNDAGVLTEREVMSYACRETP